MTGLPQFNGEIVEFYDRFRRGYPPAVIDAIVEEFDLDHSDVVVDLGCGTGQLSVPLAERVGAVVGVDPSADMLTTARRHAGVSWVLGAAQELPTLGRALRPLGAVTVAVAIHWMDRAAVFAAAKPLLRAGGGIAVVTNSVPLWMYDTEWSRELRRCLQSWRNPMGVDAGGGWCETDDAGRLLTRTALEHGGFATSGTTIEYSAALTVDEIVGGIFSAMDPPAAAERERFTALVAEALGPFTPITELVSVKLQFGTPR